MTVYATVGDLDATVHDRHVTVAGSRSTCDGSLVLSLFCVSPTYQMATEVWMGQIKSVVQEQVAEQLAPSRATHFPRDTRASAAGPLR